ncbi:MAG: IucA/IucC family protein, partial [Actinomycetota bacterium]
IGALRPPQVHPDRWLRLLDEIASSIAIHALGLIAEVRRRERLTASALPADGGNALRWASRIAAVDAGFSPLAVFEQAVVDGHPLHPCARIRSGMTMDELFAYTPEWVDDLNVGVIAIARPWIVDHGLTDLLIDTHPEMARAAARYLRGEGLVPADFALLPIHPWQLRHKVADRGAEAEAGRIIILPDAKIPARPLLSVRTLAPTRSRRAPHIKTALDVQLTGALRIVSPAAVHNAPRMSRLLAEISKRERAFGGRFAMLGELASARYRPAAGEPAARAGSLGAILRESPERHAGRGEVTLPVTALAARSPLSGQPLMIDVVEELAAGRRIPVREAAHSFLEEYCRLALPPLLTLLSRWGVAPEAHGQNTLVVLKGGVPVRLLFRDLASIRVSPIRLARCGIRLPELAGSLSVPDDELRRRIFAPLFVTNLSEVVSALASATGGDAGDLWSLVARGCRAVYLRLSADASIRTQAAPDEAALFEPTLPVKAMLAMRLADDSRLDRWATTRNPLAEHR